jgi:hypothetical protein
VFSRTFILSLIIALSSAAFAQDGTQGELRFLWTTNAEKNAGVWVDGNYLGSVKELKGSKKVRLMPGNHNIVVRQAWYRDYVEQMFLEPGTVHTIKVSLVKLAQSSAAEPTTAELKISIIPDRAAVFMDGQFAGHSGEFDGPGQALLVPPGRHKLTVALPGYLPFETSLNLRPHQKLRISTTLSKGSDRSAGSFVSPE